MTILFDSKPRVKATRPSRVFGLGLGRNRAERLPVGPSPEDAAWAAYELNKNCRNYEVISTAEGRRFDQLAEESREMDRLCRGIILA